jgi:signal transduction histidine kinase
VLVNLLDNAVKYSPEADKVFVHMEEQGGQITVAVRDEGIGISRDNLKRIFERYYRVKDDNSSQFQGLGIGLFISHDIIQYHRGKLWVESEQGKGSTFYFSIPGVPADGGQPQ